MDLSSQALGRASLDDTPQEADMEQAYLKSILLYQPRTGDMRWINPPAGHPDLIGELAGSETDGGYTMIQINGKKYGRHRLAFLYMEGLLPENVDHIDRNPRNDAWGNLRAATFTQNQTNKGKWSKNGLPLGVRVNASSGRYSARITVQGKQIPLGSFDDANEAGNAYMMARQKYFGEFA